jgi:hypothetical protein
MKTDLTKNLPASVGDLGEARKPMPKFDGDKRDAAYVANLPPGVVVNAQPKAVGTVVELPDDMTMGDVRKLFPADDFRFVYKPCGVIRIQRIERREGRSRLVNASVVRLTHMRMLSPSR